MQLAKNLTLPDDVVNRALAILGQRGAGKTTTAQKMTELMVAAGHQVVVLDPTGVWWGLRSGLDGSSKGGLNVIIMGGNKADVPLLPTAGEIVADFVVDSGRSVVLDMSTFESNAAQMRFATAFALRLYRRKADGTSCTPVHLMIDEADSFAPQRPQPGEQAMLGAFEAIVRRGRSRGLGMTMITQRPACLNKNVLTQADAVLCLRITGQQDLVVMRDWIGANMPGGGDRQERDTFMHTLPKLGQGECWWWSPTWTNTYVRTQILRKATYDSSKAPTKQNNKAAVKLKEVDLASLSAQIQASVDQAKQNNPSELKRQVQDLQRQLDAKKREIEQLQKKAGLSATDKQLVEQLVKALKSDTVQKLVGSAEPRPQPVVLTLQRFKDSAREEQRPAAPVQRVAKGSVMLDGSKLPKAEKTILTVLAQVGRPCSKNKLALIAGYAVGGGGFNNALSRLRSLQYMSGQDQLSITQEGLDNLGTFTPLPEGEAAVAHWINKLPKAESAILSKVSEVYFETSGQGLTKQDLAAQTGYAANGGGFNNALSKLRTLELIEGRDTIQLHQGLDL